MVAALLCGASAMDLVTQRNSHMASLAEVANSADKYTHFAAWMTQHGKSYMSDAREMAHRFSVWLENLEYIMSYNQKHTSHWLGLNSLADLTQAEYSQRYLGFDGTAHKNLKASKLLSKAASPFKYADVDAAALPKSVDWRALNAVTEVKNQGKCGSCWAFSTTGAIEGVNAIYSKELVSVSEQELVDCDTEQDKGCNGGLMDFAFEFVVKNKGIDTEEHYPYTAMAGKCDARHKRHHVVSIDGFEDIPENDEVSLKKAAAHQPISVAIEADQKAFQLYLGGVFSDDTCGTELDHGVLVAGYGEDPIGGAYYIVKNSWGGDWGEKGYIRLKAGVKAKEGLCGIAMAASYPTKTTPNPPKPGPDPKPEPGPPGPKPPGPITCDDTSECPIATTCCCVTDFLSVCLQWGCCPIEEAICCQDKQHCCPPSLPVCDTAEGRCLPSSGPGGEFAAAAAGKPWLTKTPAKRNFHRISALFMRGSKASKEAKA